MRFRTRVVCGVVGVTALLSGVATPSAGAGGGGPVVSAPLYDGLIGPLQFEVSPSGKVLVGQSFSGTVSLIDRNGAITDLFNDPGVDGVSQGKFGSVIYTHTDFDTGVIDLRMRTAHGETKIIADLIGHETTRNPDQSQVYGLQGLTDECAAGLPPDEGILPYTGIIDSHPYAIAPTTFGWYVADAGANAILFVDWRGKVKTVAVLPPQAPLQVSAELAASGGLPDCVIGSQFIAEPVPTDVEIGPDGLLYVTTLPGGPEDPSLGARGSVYRVHPWKGTVKQIATGFAAPTNLAISPWGTIFVAELFGGQVSKVWRGGPVPVAAVNQPAGLEWARGKLYVSYDIETSGKIATISL